MIHREILTNELEREEKTFLKQKTHLLTIKNQNILQIASLLIPVFIWGWQKAKNKELSRSLKNIIKFSVRSLLFLWKR